MKKFLTKKNIIIAVSSVVVLAAAIAGVIVFAQKEDKPEPTTEAVLTTAEPTTVEPTTEKPKTRSYLTGEYVSKKQAEKRPVAVMINNIVNAIPQSGISNAEVIYEAPVEGSITRMMAIFDDYEDLSRIGSIRSCRIYYPKFANQWDAIYVHFGQSKYALDFLRSGKMDTLSALNHEASFYRESGKVAPHNLYAKGEKIASGIKALKYKTTHDSDYNGYLQFADPEDKISLKGGKTANKVELGYRINHPWFEFNESDGQYYRYQYGGKHIDDLNNEQLHCSNIIIQFVDATLFPDGKSLNMTLTGSGKGYFITNGKAEKITWKKDSDMGQTKYFDKNGDEITLNTGKSWVCVVQNEYASDVKISK